MEENTKNFILIYYYHDTFVKTFDLPGDLLDSLVQLKQYHLYDDDFKYEIYYGKNITESFDSLDKICKNY